jgi:hypothetical protein
MYANGPRKYETNQPMNRKLNYFTPPFSKEMLYFASISKFV